jgi:hypothetical protein
VIAEFDAGDTEATLLAMAAQIVDIGGSWLSWQVQSSWRGSERPSR